VKSPVQQSRIRLRFPVLSVRPQGTPEVFNLKRLIAIAFVLLGTVLSLEGQNSGKAKELTARETEFSQVLLRSDWKALEQIEADALIFTNADGSVTHKSDDETNLRSGNVKFDSIEMRDVNVQDFGDIAVVTGQLTERGRYKATDLSGLYRFTDVWVKRDGRWQLVAGQETLVPSSK
jgi:ketosteroid isomerase-like protein